MPALLPRLDFIRVDAIPNRLPLHSTAATRHLEIEALGQHPPFVLMERAGLVAARWILSLQPHARSIWVFAGPGNNGGDGLVAARWLHGAGLDVRVILHPSAQRTPADAAHALAQAVRAGVPVLDQWPTTARSPDVVVDALLGLGQTRPPAGNIEATLRHLLTLRDVTVFALDQPTGLCADRGHTLSDLAVRAHHTLSFLTLKPGLFTSAGQDHAGTVWWAPLVTPTTPGVAPEPPSQRHRTTSATAPVAELTCRADAQAAWPPRRAAQHKGTFGDVWVVGGAPGMTGATVLAARAALAAGAGRVFWCTLGAESPPGSPIGHHPHDPLQPELMPRSLDALHAPSSLEAATVVCGCGGGPNIATVLPDVILRASRLVLDADGLNAVANTPALAALLEARHSRGLATILTPHPLEAARLLGCSVSEVQKDRLRQSQRLAEQLGAVVVLKGSGTIICSPTGSLRINPTGNARLGTAGSGDVLAGWLGGGWAQQGARDSCEPASHIAFEVAAAAVWWHGKAAESSNAPGAGCLPIPAGEQIAAMRSAVSAWPPLAGVHELSQAPTA